MNIDAVLLSQLTWLVFIVVWGGIRFRPNIKSRKMSISVTSRTLSERFSMIVSSFGLGYIPGYWVISNMFPKLGLPPILNQFNYEPNIVITVIGIICLFFSLRMFRLTHKALGKMWSHSLDLREGHKLVTSGVYENVRHPMYTAFWLWAIGAAFLLPNWVAGFSGIVGFGTLFFLRVGQEEALMRSEFGEEYDAYVARTKRVIPKIY